MTEQRRLLILGLLYQRDMHGYMLNAHLGMTMPISLKKPTAYNILESLEREGLVAGSQEATGDRKRRVYTLSELGRERYVEMLQKQLAEFIPGEYPGMVSMSFLDDLPQEEAKRALAKRLEKIKSFTEELATHSQDRDAGHQGGGPLALAFMKDVVELELKYVQELLKHLEEHP
jgi:DNA-binding PadR family transcriptional regulator